MAREPKSENELRRKFSKLGAAGKGDAPRPVDDELYELGLKIIQAVTPEEREHWEQKWRRAKKRKRK